MYSIEKLLADLRSDRKKKVILDTDTYNEIDDQFALAHLMQSGDRVCLCGITAAPFYNWRSESFADGARRSFEEIIKIRALVDPFSSVPVFAGSDRQMASPQDAVSSAAADFIIKTARETEAEPLYILGIGAATNIASAIVQAPDIVDKIAVVWLGGNEVSIGSNAGEFNLDQDFNAARVLFESDVAFVQFPASNVTSTLWINENTMKEELTAGNNPLCLYLLRFFWQLKGERENYGRIIWDIAGSGCFTVPEASDFEIQQKPALNIGDYTYDFSSCGGRQMIYVSKIDPHRIIRDMFMRIQTIPGGLSL